MKEKSTLARQDPVLYPEPRAIPGEVPQWAVMLRYFYRQRFRLLFYLLLFLGIGLVGFLLYPKTTEGLLTLTFPGIEKHEYPSGRQFSVEDFRNPQILLSALGDVGIPREKIDLRKIAGKVYVTSIIPDEVLNRWKKQAREGAIKESYYPYEFKIAIEMPGLSDEQCIRSFDALVKRYQEQVKYEQRTALSFLSGGRATSYHDLAQRYDYWDIPNIFEQIYSSMFRQLNTLIGESVKARDSRLQLKFRDLERNLAIWYGSRLQSLTAVTITGGLVKDKDLMIKRIQFQLDDLAIQIRQKTVEAAEATRLLEKVDRPKTLLAGQLSSREGGMPMIDASAMDRLMKSDYVGPVVGRISGLQQEIQGLEATKARLQSYLVLLPKFSNIKEEQLPSGYRELVETTSTELHSVIGDYNKVLDEYLTDAISSLVFVRQAPTISRAGFSSGSALLLILASSFFLAFAATGVEHVFRIAKQQIN